MAEIFRYPIKNIGPQDDYFKIDVIQYVAPGLETSGGFGLQTTEEALSKGSIQKSLSTIILPMPQNISDTNIAGWTSSDMNPLQAALTSGVSNIVNSENPGLGVYREFSNISKQLTAALTDGSGQSAVSAGSAALALNAALGQGDINAIVSRATGQVFNQNVELLFNGVSLRPAYQFSFDLFPRSEKESLVIKKIIRTFKKNMTAQRGKTEETGGGLFIKAPNVFKLEYKSGGKSHPYLHKFKPCALTQMSMDYNASGQYSTYPDATPVHMRLSLQFQELSVVYAEDYKDSDVGVGY